jgi:hypothetical protein
MNRAEFEQDLQGFFHNEAGKVKHSEGWWDDVVSMATGKKPVYTAPKSGFFKKKLFLIPVAVILALVVTGGTVYGYSSFLKEHIEIFVPSTVNEETGEAISLAQEYDLSQTIDEITASLVYAYADMNEVVVGVSVEGEKYYTVSLFTDDGQELDGGPIGLGNGGDCALTFDTPSIQGMPSSLSLRMEISVSDDMEPFVFDFEVPYYGGKIINVGQTAEAAGVTIELESLLISPGETRAIFYISPQTDERGSYAIPMRVFIQIPDGSEVKINIGGGNNSGELSATEYFRGDLTSQSGEWIITITELVYPAPLTTSNAPIQYIPESETIRLTGPWVFTVHVE